MENAIQTVQLHIHNGGTEFIGTEFAAAENGRVKSLHLVAEKGDGAAVLIDQRPLKKLLAVGEKGTAFAAADDFEEIKLNGVYDLPTQNAIKSLQRKALIESNGRLDAQAFNLLADEYERINSRQG